MKKRSFKTLALCGLLAGLAITESANGVDTKAHAAKQQADDPNAGNLGYHLMTEEELLLELNGEGVTLYNSLTPEGKLLARKVASSRCNGANECKGLNACSTDKNDCAGKGSCKGLGKCAISDKNLAVKLVAKKLADKRTQTLNSK